MRKLLGLLLLAVMPLAACSDDDGTGPSATIEGTYTLRTINGTPLPFAIEAPGYKFEFLSSTLTINAGGTFTEVDRFRETVGTSVSTDEETTTGSYLRVGNNITLSDGSGATFAGVWDGNDQLTFTQSDVDGTFVFVFRK